MIGQRFGLLVVEAQATSQNGRYWDCRCDCGTLRLKVRASSLRRGDVKSCGPCTKGKKRLPPGTSSMRSLLFQYKHRAERDGIAFNLDESLFQILTSSKCSYCGRRPGQIIRNGKDSYTFTGIDRLDNGVGYLPHNCVPCCKTCNYAKREMSADEFRAWIKEVYENWASQSSGHG